MSATLECCGRAYEFDRDANELRHVETDGHIVITAKWPLDELGDPPKCPKCGKVERLRAALRESAEELDAAGCQVAASNAHRAANEGLS